MSNNLKLDPQNIRKHSDRNKKAIRKSLETVGAGRSILIDATDTVLAGNGVFEQAQEIGLPVRVIESDGTELIAVKRTDLSGTKARQAAALDNIVADTSAYDYDAARLAELVQDDAVIAALAKEDARLLAAMNAANVVNDPSQEWQGMPEFKQEDKLGIKTIFVHFNTQEDIDAFAQLVGQPITDKTKYIWYPKQEPFKAKQFAYTDES